MKAVIIAISMSLLASSAQAYVYSYPVSIALNGQSNSQTEGIWSGPNPPLDMSQADIAAVDSRPNVHGRTPYANVGDVVTSYFEDPSPPPFGVFTEPSPVGLGPIAAALSSGEVVGPDSTWGSSGVIGGYIFAPTLIKLGDPAFLASPFGAYVGIKFSDNNNQIHYGWLQVRYDQPADSYFGTIELFRAAYETEPNVPITVGETPEPGCGAILLGVLFAGEFACRRRSRTA